MRLGTKIIISFICISLLLAVVGIVSYQFTSQIRQEQLYSANEASQVVIYTGEMERSLFQSLIFLNGIREALIAEKSYSTIQELPAVADLKSNFERELDKFESALSELEMLLGKNERLPENINELIQSYEVYKSVSREWLSLNGEDNERANLMFLSSIEPYFRNNIIPKITKLRNFVLEIQKGTNEELDESLRKAELVNYIATIFSILIAIVLAIYIYRSIANPISRVSLSAKKIGKGNLNERIEVTSKGELGELAEAFNHMVAGLQKTTVSKAYLDNIIESMQEAVFVADNDGILIRANSAAGRMVGYKVAEMIDQPLTKFYNFTEMGDSYEKKKNTDRSFEFSLKHKDETTIPVLFSEAELLDHQNKTIGTVAVASDISERKEAEKKIRDSLKEKEVMLAEIHHRVKNNLAVISGLLQLQSHSANNTDVEKALSESQMRIQSIALVHEMLYESESLAYIEYDKYINDLLQAISSMHNREDRAIELISDVEPILLSINQAIPCSLLINELIVNAYKYAFSGQKKGQIKVFITVKGENIVAIISDNGNGFDVQKFANSDSLGATLIKTLTKQLNGEFEVLENEDHSGSLFRIQFMKEK